MSRSRKKINMNRSSMRSKGVKEEQRYSRNRMSRGRISRLRR